VWRSICQSVQGGRHRLDGADCQDHSLVRYIGDTTEGALVACVADGAGTAALSGVGSRLACEAIVRLAMERFEEQHTLADLQESEVVQWCERTRQRLESAAEARQRELRDFATTLCGAVIARQQSIFFQIGDGAIVARRHGVLGVVFWPQSGEYLNTTSFLTSPNFQERLQVRLVQGGFADVALFTDGVERLALQFDLLAPHVPFFHPLFAAVRAIQDVDALAEDLKRFLVSDSVTMKNDDDKTLLLACRIADEVRHVA
jgi:serine/threonine protein phosphatase PrpC